MDLFLFIIGVIGGAVFLGWLAAALIRKTPKKTALIGLGVCAVLAVTGLFMGGSGSSTDQSGAPPAEQTVTLDDPEKPETNAVKNKPKKPLEVVGIESTITSRVNSGDYKNVKLDRFAVNKNLGAGDGTYIALVYLKFDISNSKSTGNETMRRYSDDLVAALAKNTSSVCEAVIFWDDEYNDRKLKYTYKYRNGGFYLTNKVE